MKNVVIIIGAGAGLYFLSKRAGVFSLSSLDKWFPQGSSDWEEYFYNDSYSTNEWIDYLGSATTAVAQSVAPEPVVLKTIKNVINNFTKEVPKTVLTINDTITQVVTGETETMRNEGLRLSIYKDSEGFDTIGYGHKLTAEDKRTGRFIGGITKAQALQIYKSDHAKAKSDLYRNLPWVSSQPQQVQDALLDMTFNMGIGSASSRRGLLGFKNTLAYIKAGDYERAANGILNSKYASQVGNRAVRNANKVRTA